MRSLRRLAPVLAAGALALVVAAPAVGITWSAPVRVTPVRGSELSALHELAAGGGRLHLAYARLGPETRDDTVVYQRSSNGGVTWSRATELFGSTSAERIVTPNLAVAAAKDQVVVAWRTRGTQGTSLWIRRSTDGGSTWKARQRLFQADGQRTLGTPAVSLVGDTLVVATTNRATGNVLLRRSADGGASFGPSRVMGRTHLSIDCQEPVIDALVGLGASGDTVHLAWSDAKAGSCIASELEVRTSRDDGVTWKQARVASTQRTYGWPELAVRGDTLLITLQRPDGALVITRSTDGGRTFDDIVMKPSGDRALGAADVLLPSKDTAWLVYADVAYRGNDIASSRVRIKTSTNGGRTWGTASDVLGSAAKLRQAVNVAAYAAKPVVVLSAGPTNGSTADIVAVHQQ